MSDFFRPMHQDSTGPQNLQRVSQPWHLPELSIYITDSCALSCTGCISFNNYALGNHLEITKEIQDRIESWASLVSVDRLYIIGGEPLSHPRLNDWMALAQKSWPRSRWTIVTNGRGIENRTAEVMSWLEEGWDIEISSHSTSDFEQAQTWWNRLLSDMLITVPGRRLRDDSGITDYWEDPDGAPMMQIGLRNYFFEPTHQVNDQGQLEWPKLTAPRTTHSLCGAKDCTHLVDGIMYRCPVQATLPRLSSRFEIVGPAREIAQKNLGYDPLAKNKMSLSTWMNLLNQPTDQCRLCKWPRDRKALGDPTVKKVKLMKRVSPSSQATEQEHPAILDDGEHLPTASSQA